MSFAGFQLNKTNTDGTPTTIATNAAVLFDATNLFPTPDGNITYTAATGTFTFAEGNSYFVYWNVNIQSSPDADARFAIEVTTTGETPTTTSYPSSSIFKTGQVTGSALITPVDGGTMKLVNKGASTVTLAIGANVVTAGISIFTVSGISNFTGVQAALDNTVNTIAADAIIPFNSPTTVQTSTGISLDTVTTKGEVTITRHGTYTVDWTMAISSAEGATQICVELRDNAESPNTISTVYAPVVSEAFISGTSIIAVNEAQVAAGFKFALYNATKNTADPSLGVAIALAPITVRATIRITGAN